MIVIFDCWPLKSSHKTPDLCTILKNVNIRDVIDDPKWLLKYKLIIRSSTSKTLTSSISVTRDINYFWKQNPFKVEAFMLLLGKFVWHCQAAGEIVLAKFQEIKIKFVKYRIMNRACIIYSKREDNRFRQYKVSLTLPLFNLKKNVVYLSKM